MGTRDITAMTHVCVVGLRYVGLPLALQFARSAATVVGLDIDENKIKQLNGGASYIKHVAAAPSCRKSAAAHPVTSPISGTASSNYLCADAVNKEP